MKKQILIVEADADLNVQYTKQFQHSGYHVVSVHAAQNALAYLQNTRPDVVIVSLNLPSNGSVNIYNFLRNQYRDNLPMVIAITRLTHAETIIISKFKPDFVLVHPIVTEELLILTGDRNGAAC